MKVELIQRSPEWFSWRKGKIGSSQAASIMEKNPWCSPHQEFEKMKGLTSDQYITSAMQKGIDFEDRVREAICEKLDMSFIPACYEHDEHPYLISSLDGIDEKKRIILEIKVSLKTYLKAKQGIVDPMYYCQMMHQMMTTGIDNALLGAHNGMDADWINEEDIIILEVKKNQSFIDEMMEKELKFIEYLKNNDDSALQKFKAIEIQDDCRKIIEEWISISQKIKEMEENEKRLKAMINSLSEEDNCFFICHGDTLIKKSQVVREGNVDWKALCKANKIEDEQINQFRKKPISYHLLKTV